MSEDLTEGLHTIQTKWSIDDAADAHDALDYLDALRQQARKQ